jgi:2-keto-4-pentenoate hydratase/2-oxohepta-3-ene-1,7-dioic acid hydratase in catechol pathway
LEPQQVRLTVFEKDGGRALGVRDGDNLIDVTAAGVDAPSDISEVLQAGPELLDRLRALPSRASQSARLSYGAVKHKALALRFPKAICLGLNYLDHAAEAGFSKPEYPTIFLRVGSSFVGHREPIVRPRLSDTLDFEGELVAFLGTGGRHVARENALGLVAGYSVFNDASIREYQTKTTQWTIGKNFDATGAFGPDFVAADELPPGGAGLKIETRLNGQTVQSASTSDMIFGVASTIEILSKAITLQAGDILVMGTPSGVGGARNPKLFMKAGDVCEVEIERVGLLVNPIVDED